MANAAVRASAPRETRGTEPHGRECRLDRARGPQMDPVLGRGVVERKEGVELGGDLVGRFRVLGELPAKARTAVMASARVSTE